MDVSVNAGRYRREIPAIRFVQLCSPEKHHPSRNVRSNSNLRELSDARLFKRMALKRH